MLLKVVRNYKLKDKFYPRNTVITIPVLTKELERLVRINVFRVIPPFLEKEVTAKPQELKEVVIEPKKKKVKK